MRILTLGFTQWCLLTIAVVVGGIKKPPRCPSRGTVPDCSTMYKYKTGISTWAIRLSVWCG